MFTRLTSLTWAVAILAVCASFAPVARAGSAAFVRDLSQTPADVRWRHSGHQGPGGAPEYFGKELATGDFNHDGKTDLVVTADTDTGASDAHFGRGFVYVYFGTGSAMPAEIDPAEQHASCKIFGQAPFGYFGRELAVGDFDGDGVDDLAVSQLEGYTVNKGAVFVFSGTMIAANPELHVDQGQYTSRIEGRTFGTSGAGRSLYFGFAMTAGDLNGDGVDDLAVGAFGGYGADGQRKDIGDVEVFFGRATWTKDFVADLGNTDVFLTGRRGGDNFGTELAAGDVDGDGRAELLVSTYGSDGPDGTRSQSGDVSIFSFGAASSVQLPLAAPATPAAVRWDSAVVRPSAIVYGPNHGSRVGSSSSNGGGTGLAVGDVDGDGIGDVVIGSPFDGPPAPNSKSSGSVFVVWGAPSLTSGQPVDLVNASNAPTAAASTLAHGEAGVSLGDTVRLGDFNHDGRADVIAGAPDYGGARGYVAVYGGRSRAEYGAGDTLLPAPDAVVLGATPVWRFGDDAVFLDSTFSGRAMLAVGETYGGWINLSGRGYAGEVAGVAADGIAASLPRSPSIAAQASVVLAPSATATVPVSATAGTGTVVSVTSPDLPAFASIQTVDASAGLYTLALNPTASDRGSFSVTLVATDSAGATAARRVAVTVGFTPAISGVRLKQISAQTYRLTIDGGGFVAGEAVITVAGESVTPVKYPGKFLEPNGVTVRRLTVKSARLSALVPNGQTVFVTVTNPREGLVSAPVSLTR